MNCVRGTDQIHNFEMVPILGKCIRKDLAGQTVRKRKKIVVTDCIKTVRELQRRFNSTSII